MQEHNRRRITRRMGLALIACALGSVAGCTTTGSGTGTSTSPASGSSRTAREVSAAVGRADEGVTAGPTGGAPVGTRQYRGLDDHERRRLLEAARQAFVTTTDQTFAFTVVPENIDAEPTGVSAAPAGAPEVRADGSTCRPLKLSVTKNGHTTVGTLTFCREPGGDIKPATKM